MNKERSKGKKKCSKKGKVMILYGIIQLSSSIVSAIALTTIALNLYEVKKEASIFNKCFEDVNDSRKSSSIAVNFCNGGE